MTADDDRPDAGTPGPDYRTLPPAVRLEDTVETVETAPAPELALAVPLLTEAAGGSI